MQEIKIIYLGIGMVSIALSIVMAKAIEGISRNPDGAGKIVTMSMIAAAFVELCVLLMIFVHMTSAH